MSDGFAHKSGLSRRELLKRSAAGAGGVALFGTFAQPVWAYPF